MNSGRPDIPSGGRRLKFGPLGAAAKNGVPLVIFTFCYSDPTDLRFFEDFESLILRTHGELLPVFLHCSEFEIARRIGNPDRIQRGKTSSVEGLRQFRIRYNDAPVPRANCFKMDSGAKPPEEAAREIIRHFDV